ncbi:MAG: branched-chain amino acid ABC transporter permease [Paracoccaceae bacterium]|nr:branched-chain amino acid ABC transporter permease [Paracoccaceae bacterium]
MADVSEAAAPLGRFDLTRIPAHIWVIVVLLLLVPTFTSGFVQFQIFGWAFILGMISLSLMILAGYGGMVSLVQMTAAAAAGYAVAIFGASAVAEISFAWPWPVAVILAIAISVLVCVISGALAIRTEGIYTIMITLAIGSAFFYFTRQNYTVFNGFTGFNGVQPPQVFGVTWNDPTPFYYLTLACAALSYFFAVYLARTPFGLALQGVRDNPRRMAAMGYNVNAHRLAAYAVAGVISGVAGVLLVWSTGQISPNTAAIGPIIDILVITVIGGINRPIGPFVGALIYVVLRTYSLDVLTALGLDGERFKLLIGMAFLLIVYFSPDGMCGIWDRYITRLWRDPKREGADG